ncbi:MAG TPA: penicillin-binding transpeptidase domain-containing protein [bacterium]|nr:penicillin-binding transpeptidase domain-containing protein [bacterium]
MNQFLLENAGLIQGILTIISSGFICLLVWKSRIQRPDTSSPSRMFRIHSGILAVLIVLIPGYQARWQLFGFFSSGFLRVQRGFDPRDDILGTRFHRGDLLDWKHRILATDIKTGEELHRHYPLGAATVHAVGYVSSIYGASGLEQELDSALMGRSVQTPADVFRLTANVFFHQKLRGNPVVLTIDRDLQAAAHKLLADQPGAIVALDPRDGSIRAMVSSPGFDPGRLDRNHWNTLQHRRDSPFLNRVCQGLYPPGSTFKPMVAAAAVSREILPVFVCGSDGFDCGPADPRVRDYEHYARKGFQGHGRLNLAEAMAESCNVYFAQLAVRLTAETILHDARNAGFDDKIPFAGPGLPVSGGRLPERSRWPVARTARLGIGQDDLLLTPLHLALYSGAIGQGGMMFRPKLVEGRETILWKRLMDHRTANRVARMMIKVVETGTGQHARVAGIVVGGKTGTAENAGEQSHAMFIGFAPWPDPALAIAVVVEEGGLGGRRAAPIAGKLVSTADSLGLLEDREIIHDPPE